MAEPTGLARMMEEAGAGEQLLEGSAEQLSLLGMAIPASSRVAGRPAGRVNKRNQRVADIVLSTVGDPLMEISRMAMLPVDALAAALGVTKAEAFAEKRLCAAVALPYLHQRQAIALDVSNRNIVHLSILDGSAAAGVDAGAIALASGVAEIVINQEVSDAG